MVPLSLLNDEYGENPAYLSESLITYLGNKRALVRPIESVVWHVRRLLGGRRLRSCDPFAGSGVRMLKQHSDYQISNNFEAYAACIGRAFLTNQSSVDYPELVATVSKINQIVESGGGPTGFIRDRYAPHDDEEIQAGERVFYTGENARRLDAYAQLKRQSDPKLRDLLLGSLLSEASIHANTGGVFKGFYKDPDTGIGKYGGKGEDALERIMAMTGRNKYSREVVAYEQAARTHQARVALPNPPRTGGTSRGIMD